MKNIEQDDWTEFHVKSQTGDCSDLGQQTSRFYDSLHEKDQLQRRVNVLQRFR